MAKRERKKKNESGESSMSKSKGKKTALPKDRLFELPGFPNEEELKDGPVAIIECPEEIPCNVCEAACPFEAIEIGREIKNLPELDPEKCVGCGVCVSQCPGLAIYVLDTSYSKEEALLTLPYEFTPLPEEGEKVTGVNREGEEVCPVTVKKVDRKDYGTALLKIVVPKDKMHTIRGILATNLND